MNILFDIGHPAHVHLFRNLISKLQADQHKVIVASRKKDLTTDLLDQYKIDHQVISQASKGLLSNFVEMLCRDTELLKLNRQHQFDLAIGTSVSIGHLSLLSNVRSLNFNEDDDDSVPLYAWAAYPFSSKIINPECLKYTRWKRKRMLHNSYHELAYLHPDDFTPDRSVPERYGFEPGNYCIIRKSSLQAHHDKHAKGLEKELWKQVIAATECLPQVISIEGKKTHQISPTDMHDMIAFSKLIISDSQTMSAEAAVLGVPSIRFSSFAGHLSYLEELEHQYGLTYGFQPLDSNRGLELLKELVASQDLSENWKSKRANMLADKSNFNKVMLDLIYQG